MNEDPAPEAPRPDSDARQSKLIKAMVAYGVLCLLGAILLEDKVRVAVLLMLVAFMAKTLIAHKAGW